MDKKLMHKIAMEKINSGKLNAMERRMVGKDVIPYAYDYEKQKWLEGDEALPRLKEIRDRTEETLKKQSPQERRDLFRGEGKKYARRHGLGKLGEMKTGRDMLEDASLEFPDLMARDPEDIPEIREMRKGKASRILGNERGSVGPAKGRPGAMKIAAELEPDEAMKATIAKMTPGGKLKKFGKAALKGAAALGAIGTGMEAIDYVKEAADEELERKDEAAMYKASEDQYAKTKAKILKDKTGESLKNIKSLQASTKKNTPKVKSAPKTIPTPKGKSDEQKTKDYMGYMKSQLGTDYEDDAPKAKSSDMGAQKWKKQAGVSQNPFDAPVARAMKRAAKEVNEGPYGKGTDRTIEKTVKKLRGE